MDVAEAWQAVHREAARLKPKHLRDLFADDPQRFSRLSVVLDDLTLDFSKEKLDAPALSALLDLARAAGVEAKREALFSGAPWNLTEGRAVLHMALRGGAEAPADADVTGTLDRFLAFAEAVRSGGYAAPGGPFTDVINIGIGGSDLGPAMAATALRPDCDGPRLHFVSNVDGAHVADVTRLPFDSMSSCCT
jgi:glucose-6-phosphate isomerase